MAADTELLTLPEAAVVASVTVRDINRVIDEKILPERFYTLEGGRHLHVAACPLVGFYFHAAKALTSEERGLLIRRLSDRIGPGMAHRPIARWRKSSRPADWTINDGFLTVSLWEFAIGAEDRHAKLAEAREMVVEDPDILDGTPVIRGTRIPVHDIAASVAVGLSHERIRSAYSGLDDRVIELATIYAEATPLRGRPKRPVALPSGTKIVSERKVARRRLA
ncbi:MAG: DUF433 domain-containing protein [Alphaproteobacteria bacterium]|nr:DUF433 domain-containing protein [Alphaproteobacteria bacterium]